MEPLLYYTFTLLQHRAGIDCFPLCACPDECKAPFVISGANLHPPNGGVDLEQGVCKMWASAPSTSNGTRFCGDGFMSNPHRNFYVSNGGVNCAELCGGNHFSPHFNDVVVGTNASNASFLISGEYLRIGREVGDTEKSRIHTDFSVQFTLIARGGGKGTPPCPI